MHCACAAGAIRHLLLETQCLTAGPFSFPALWVGRRFCPPTIATVLICARGMKQMKHVLGRMLLACCLGESPPCGSFDHQRSGPLPEVGLGQKLPAVDHRPRPPMGFPCAESSRGCPLLPGRVLEMRNLPMYRGGQFCALQIKYLLRTWNSWNVPKPSIFGSFLRFGHFCTFFQIF